jgi:hypothetical protein
MTTRTLATEIAMATLATKVATSIASIAMKPVVVVAPSVTTKVPAVTPTMASAATPERGLTPAVVTSIPASIS